MVSNTLRRAEVQLYWAAVAQYQCWLEWWRPQRLNSHCEKNTLHFLAHMRDKSVFSDLSGHKNIFYLVRSDLGHHMSIWHTYVPYVILDRSHIKSVVMWPQWEESDFILFFSPGRRRWSPKCLRSSFVASCALGPVWSRSLFTLMTNMGLIDMTSYAVMWKLSKTQTLYNTN